MASLSVGIAAIVIHATGFIPLLPYCDLHLWPQLPPHMLWDWELVGLYAFQVLNAPLQCLEPAKWLLSTVPWVLGWFRLVSARGEWGGSEGRWVLVVVEGVKSMELWLEWLTPRKVSWEAWERSSCLNGSFLSLFSPWPGLRLRMVIYECVGERERERGCSETHQPSLMRRLGLAEVPVIGSLIYTCMHTSARTLLRTPPRATRTEERTLLRGRFGKRGVLHTIAVRTLIYASQASKPHETSWKWRPLTRTWSQSWQTFT